METHPRDDSKYLQIEFHPAIPWDHLLKGIVTVLKGICRIPNHQPKPQINH